MSDLDPKFVEHLCNVSWYTADRKLGYLVKASASLDNGYTVLITDL